MANIRIDRNGVAAGKLRGGAHHIQSRSRIKHLGRRPRLRFEWTETISDDQWETYRDAIHALRAAGLEVMLGGGFAMASYTGRWRNTKDIDFYILEKHREQAVAALAQAGFQDYFETLPYDRKWIYRSTRGGVIVDIIWAMANQRAQVDERWFDGAPEISIRGERLKVVPMEEFVWCKLYILQRDHCDWTDVMNVLFAAGSKMDWDYLLWRLGEDWALLKSLLTLYGWVCPRQAARLPESLRKRLKLDKPVAPRRRKYNRIRLLDSRDWFAALLTHNQPLAV
jgi:hypothetical protein